MSYLYRWLIEALTVERLPYRWLMFAFVFPSSIYGGVMYAHSGSWLTAIQWDITIYCALWLIVKPAEWVGEKIARAMLWFIPIEN
jgi:hypothetical protein